MVHTIWTLASPMAESMAEQDALAALRAENTRLIKLLEAHGIAWRRPPEPAPQVSETGTSKLSTREKVALFRRLFRGRDDVATTSIRPAGRTRRATDQAIRRPAPTNGAPACATSSASNARTAAIAC
ncbi:hypothetical protein [uncultured Thiocystis sp.]|uniref:hypothetical protein n=1 Tax=uncultured Thiocystis sp. TaxID=1202134 RepID=UPI0025EFA1A3|nr:hypothetical protein [uncultured Thiocystis sp.]